MRNVLQRLAILTALVLLISAAAYPAQAAKLTDAQYADLFQRASNLSQEGIKEELENAFIDDPRGFVAALAKENYGTMYFAILSGLSDADWVNDMDRMQHHSTLLQLAADEELTQAERRVVKWLIVYTGLAQEYDIFAIGIDYPELFSRIPECEGFLTYKIQEELLQVFQRDATQFVKALAQEDPKLQQLAIQQLASAHYYDYGNEGFIGDAMKSMLADSGKLSKTELQLVDDFWTQIDAWEAQSATQPTTRPSTVIVPSTTRQTQPVVSIEGGARYTGTDIVFRFSGVAQKIYTLYILHPDGNQYTFPVPKTSGDSMTLVFASPGEYTVWISEKNDYGVLLSKTISFQLFEKVTLTTQSVTTQPVPVDEEEHDDPVKASVIWVIVGVVAVIFGVQAVVLVLQKKKGPQEDEF